jgi:hypothetical protein
MLFRVCLDCIDSQCLLVSYNYTFGGKQCKQPSVQGLCDLQKSYFSPCGTGKTCIFFNFQVENCKKRP